MLTAVILAAGKGTRFKSSIPKPLHEILGINIIELIIKQLVKIKFINIVVVVGHKGDLIKDKLKKYNQIKFVNQQEQLGTAHALLQARKYLNGNILVLSADTPLITYTTINSFLKDHIKNQIDCTVVTGVVTNPLGYGRIIRDKDKLIKKIVEETELNISEKKINEINSGIYVFNGESLNIFLNKITNKNKKNEFYLTDIIEFLIENKLKVSAFLIKDTDEIIGVNDRIQLYEATKKLQKRINNFWMKEGVSILDPQNTYISPDVKINRDVIIDGHVHILGNTNIDTNTHIIGSCFIKDSSIGKNNNIKDTYISCSVIANNNIIGPFTNIRDNANIGSNNRIGNFVEIKDSQIGNFFRASHLSYIGDANIEDNVNFGCGSITVNYNGVEKFKTHIKKDAFIGCNSNLIAPLSIGKNSLIAAGATVKKDVLDNELCIGCRKQVNIAEKGKELKKRFLKIAKKI